MANIPLRAYIRDIEGLIDSGQLEETVAHCRHVLKSFPKYVFTYRILGKVFLEGKQFTNAADILQRVLSAVPDDFVSHVGMSIIREDEGNLDAAIWHMERAFENQPANKAIQDELRRLFGRRDGMEPPKIRLTRGALARMYAKGNLYDQTIAELRGALSEDPQRPDLQVLLAQMHFLSGNRVDAVETSSNLIKKFPYCLIANRILALILPQTDRAEDANIYQQRALALDPYLINAGPEALTSVDVPENAVMIETLEWKPGEPISGLPEQPSWAVSLGINIEDSEEETLPDWLSEDLVIPAYEGQQVAPFSEGDEDVEEELREEETGELIPEWMQEAGWEPSDSETEEPHPIEGIYETEAEDIQIEKADIPEWLKDIAPEEGTEIEQITDEGLDEEIPTWLDESPPGPTDSIISWLGEQEPVSESEASEDLFGEGEDIEVPDWLVELKDDTAEPESDEIDESIDLDEKTDELPEWFQETDEQAHLIEEDADHDIDSTKPVASEDLPDWLEGVEETESTERTGVTDWLVDEASSPQSETILEETISEDVDDTVSEDDSGDQVDLPDWLMDLEEDEESKVVSQESDIEDIEVPEWLEDLDDSPADTADVGESLEVNEETGDLQEKQEEIVSEFDEGDQDAALAWLESLAAKHGAKEEELITSPADRDELPPEWVLEEEQRSSGEQDIETEEESLPDWLPESKPSIDDEELAAKEMDEKLPEELVPSVEDSSEDLDTEAFSTEGDETSAGIMDVGEITDQEDKDSGLAWLESLASKQGASEEELITSPEERMDEPPDWISEEADQEEMTEAPPTDSEIESEGLSEIETSEDLPEWAPELPKIKEPVQEDAEGISPILEEEVSVEEIQVEPLEEVAPKEEILININTANLSELEKIPGIGFVLAQNIIDYRQENGPYNEISELLDVPGIGEINFESFQDYLFIEEATTATITEETSRIEVDDKLVAAHNALEKGEIDHAVEAYEEFINEGIHLSEIISQLEARLSGNPENIHLWQILGDAYMRNDQFQQAIEAYTKAEKLL